MSRIVVGIDGSDNARAALQWAVAEARLRGATVRAVHAWHVQYASGYPFAAVPFEPELFERTARELLDAEVDLIDTSGLAQPIEAVLVEGSPASALLAESEDADLLVVGARGHGGFVGLLLGSVSNQVAQHARCPVVIVPSVTTKDL